MKKISSKALAGAIGATFITSMAAMPAASAAENPFAAKPLVSGYQLADAKDGTNGGKKAEPKEAHCGSKSDKDGHCGGKQAAPMEKGKKDGTCGGSK
jgi:uncharacterized low-complexity protein